MYDLEQIKLNGSIVSLKTEIQKRIHKLEGDLFSYLIDRNHRYCRLGEAITEAETLLKEIRVLLDEMHRLDPPHR